MAWLLGVVFICIIFLFLPLRVRLIVTYGEDGLYGRAHLLVWQKAIWKKQYTLKNLFLQQKQKTDSSAGEIANDSLKQKIIAALKTEWQTVFSVALKNIVIEKWLLCGEMSTAYPAVKSTLCGILSGLTGWFYGWSHTLVVWKTPPVQHIVFAQSDTNWQFQCMIKSSLGQIIGKGIKIVAILIKRSVGNGAKEGNRNAHANGYL